MMTRYLSVLTIALLALFCAQSADAQVNIARDPVLATPTTGGGGTTTYGPAGLNDGVLIAAQWCWISTGSWLQYDWPAPVKIGSFTLHTVSTASRWVSGATIQWWDGSQWVTDHTYSISPPQTIYTVDLNTPCTTTKFRLFQTVTTSFNPNFQEWQIWAPPSTEWTGDNSSDWNDPGNWSGGMPAVDLGATIPDSADTANDPTLPNGGASALTVELEPGAILNGGDGVLTVGEKWESTGGVFNPQNSLVEYAGDGDFEVISGGTNLGNVHVRNTVGDVLFTDEFSALNNGTFNVDAGANLYFQADTSTFTSSTWNNNGTIHFGLDGGGLVATTQTINASGQNLGNVEVNVIDVMDGVSFVGEIGFDTLTLSGAGTVDFLSNFTANTAVNFGMDGILTTQGILGNADLNFVGGGDVTLGQAVFGKDINHTGTGLLVINAEFRITGDANFVSTGPTTTANVGAAATGNLIGGDLNVNPSFSGGTNALTVGIVNVSGDANFIASNAEVFGLSAGKINVTTDGNVNLNLNQGSTVGDFQFDSAGSVLVANAMIVNGYFSTNGSGDVSVSNGLTLNGDLNHTSVGNFEISGELAFDGAAPQVLKTAAGQAISTERMSVANPTGVTLEGEINATQNGAINAVFVEEVAGLTLGLGAVIKLGSPGGTGILTCRGALTSTAGASTLAPRIVGGNVAADYGRVRFRSTARANLNGIVFEKIGPSGEDYGVRLSNGSDILSFNNVSITDAQCDLAAVELGTPSLPLVFEGFACSGKAGIGNIDASAISGLRIDVKESDTGSGNLYGVADEIDPNGVLYWENPPVVDILSDDSLPNALAEVPYAEMLSAAGGNEPLTWAIANNPEWLSINAITGELIGTPGRTDVGTHVFVVIASDGSLPSTSANKVMTLIVDSLTDVGVVIITPPELLTTTVGDGYGYSLSAAGGTGAGYTWALVEPNSLPAGLVLLPTGVIQGEPIAGSAGVYNFAVRVTDSNGNTGIKNFGMTVNTEFSDPGIINRALSDAPSGGGGCAIEASTSAWMLLLLVAMAGLMVYRRREV